PARQPVVEVDRARAHAADVEREQRLEKVAGRRDVVCDEYRHERRDVETVRTAPAGLEAALETRAVNVAAALRREEDRQPAVGDLRCERDVGGADGSEVHRNLGAEWTQQELQRLAETRRARPGVRDVVVLAV